MTCGNDISFKCHAYDIVRNVTFPTPFQPCMTYEVPPNVLRKLEISSSLCLMCD